MYILNAFIAAESVMKWNYEFNNYVTGVVIQKTKKSDNHQQFGI